MFSGVAMFQRSVVMGVGTLHLLFPVFLQHVNTLTNLARVLVWGSAVFSIGLQRSVSRKSSLVG